MQTNLIGLDWSTSAGEDRHLRELYACFPAASLQPQSSILKTLPPQTALVPLQRGIADVKKLCHRFKKGFGTESRCRREDETDAAARGEAGRAFQKRTVMSNTEDLQGLHMNIHKCCFCCHAAENPSAQLSLRRKSQPCDLEHAKRQVKNDPLEDCQVFSKWLKWKICTKWD